MNEQGVRRDQLALLSEEPKMTTQLAHLLEGVQKKFPFDSGENWRSQLGVKQLKRVFPGESLPTIVDKATTVWSNGNMNADGPHMEIHPTPVDTRSHPKRQFHRSVLNWLRALRGREHKSHPGTDSAKVLRVVPSHAAVTRETGLGKIPGEQPLNLTLAAEAFAQQAEQLFAEAGVTGFSLDTEPNPDTTSRRVL